LSVLFAFVRLGHDGGCGRSREGYYVMRADV
jgi:hypothetical protein